MNAASYASIILALFMMKSCVNGDYHRNLPNGYILGRTNAYTTAIFSGTATQNPAYPNHGILVAAKIDQVAVSGKWVVGHVVSSPHSEIANIQTPGFFILDTQSGQVWKGLSEAQWKTDLASRGIPTPVVLESPRSLP